MTIKLQTQCRQMTIPLAKVDNKEGDNQQVYGDRRFDFNFGCVEFELGGMVPS